MLCHMAIRESAFILAHDTSIYIWYPLKYRFLMGPVQCSLSVGYGERLILG